MTVHSVPPITTIIHDVDGCLLFWTKAFIAWVVKYKGIDAFQAAEQVSCYRFSHTFPQLSGAEVWDLMREFNESAHFLNTEEILGASTALATLRQQFPGIRQIVVTACGSHPRTIRMRAQQIEDLGFDEAYIIPLDGDKASLFAKYGAGAIVIEDSPGNVRKALAAGCTPVVMHWPYNAEIEVEHRARCWLEATRQITGIIKARELVAA